MTPPRTRLVEARLRALILQRPSPDLRERVLRHGAAELARQRSFGGSSRSRAWHSRSLWIFLRVACWIILLLFAAGTILILHVER